MMDIVGKFTTEALIRAMAPIDVVIDNFQEECCRLLLRGGRRHQIPPLLERECKQDLETVPCHNDDETTCTIHPECQWGERAQGAFAGIVKNIIQLPNGKPAPFQPTNRYIRKLLQRFASRVEKKCHLENEAFAELMFDYHLRSTKGDHPDPNSSCHVSFSLPCVAAAGSQQEDKSHPPSIIGIQIFPHHNDVGVRKVWEAGAALTEYLLKRPELVRQKNVCEIGAGVGLTGIVIAGLCYTKSVHMTDYTDTTLVNMEYNVAQNEGWFNNTRRREKDSVRPVTAGYLEWEQFSKDKQHIMDEIGDSVVAQTSQSIYQPPGISMALAKSADVLIAADVVYDRSVLPALASCVSKFLSESQNRQAIFATTYRNENTFSLFEAKLKNEGIKVSYVPKNHIEDMNHIFPCYFDQPRTDVRICTMTK